VISHLPKLDKQWIPELISWATGQYSKPYCPTLLGEEQTKQKCSWGRNRQNRTAAEG
jgi:hypothetical protein